MIDVRGAASSKKAFQQAGESVRVRALPPIPESVEIRDPCTSPSQNPRPTSSGNAVRRQLQMAANTNQRIGIDEYLKQLDKK